MRRVVIAALVVLIAAGAVAYRPVTSRLRVVKGPRPPHVLIYSDELGQCVDELKR